MSAYETTVDVRLRLRLDNAELDPGESALDAALRLVVGQLGVPPEDVLDLHELVI